MKHDAQSIQKQLKGLKSLQEGLQKRGIQPLTPEALAASIAAQDAARFADLKKQQQAQQQKKVEKALVAADINPHWTMETVQRLLHKRNPAKDF